MSKAEQGLGQGDVQYGYSHFSTWTAEIEQQAFIPLLDKHRAELEASSIGPVSPPVWDRWQGFDICLTWQTPDSISRSISAEIDYEAFKATPRRLELPISAGALITELGTLDGRIVKARDEEVARFPLPLDLQGMQRVQEALEEALTRVSSWKEADLEDIEEMRQSLQG